jgi:predicted Zn-dependent protease
VKPDGVKLIAAGRLGDALASPRSAKEYGLQTNAANAGESPESLDLAPGGLEEREVLAALDRGLYINNLWYLNVSDRPAGRITGMTRFTFGSRADASRAGEPMRFDDSIYECWDNLVELTRSRGHRSFDVRRTIHRVRTPAGRVAERAQDYALDASIARQARSST